jgi:hypothetical protein
MTVSFSDIHMYKNFSNIEGCREWWVGRLVESKWACKSKTAAIKTIEEGELGLVVDIRESSGDGLLLSIRWCNGHSSESSPLYVLSQAE